MIVNVHRHKLHTGRAPEEKVSSSSHLLGVKLIVRHGAKLEMPLAVLVDYVVERCFETTTSVSYNRNLYAATGWKVSCRRLWSPLSCRLRGRLHH